MNNQGKFQKSEIKRLNQVCKQYYEEYKQFVDNKELPDFKPQYDNNLGANTYAIAKCPNEKFSYYRILVSPKIKDLNKDVKKAVFFHEFTHIEDQFLVERQLHSHEEAHKLLGVYSEYRASRVETMVLLNFNSYSENKIIYRDDTLFYETDRQKVPVEKFLSKQREKELYNASKRLEYLNSETDNSKRLKLYLETMQGVLYYIGHVDLCAEFYTESLDEFLDFAPFSKIFGDKITKYFNLILDHREIDINALYEIKELQDEIVLDHVQY
ncbi:hypothetical protein [Caproiciproducens sp.]